MAANVRWTNWAATYQVTIGELAKPATLPELVEVVARATEAGEELHAVGSGWAYESVATSPDRVVSLSLLSSQLDYVTDHALTDGWQARQADAASEERLLHVEAGAEIGRLNQALARQGLAMITLGGANGQTLVGALSTSTHGGNPDQPPLCDLVMAMHLVTDGGREVWVERASAPITTDGRLTPRFPCPDTTIVRDDEIFNAVVCSLGRFGVIYSVVLRVRRAHRLAEWTVRTPSGPVLDLLREGVTAQTGLRPLLESLPAPPADLGAESGDNPLSPVFTELIFNSQAPMADCFIRRRWPTRRTSNLGLSFSPTFPCNTGQSAELLTWTAEAIRASSGILLAIPVVGVFWAVDALARAAALNVLAGSTPPLKGGEAMREALNALWGSHLGLVVPTLGWHALGEQFNDSMAGGRRGRSDIIMTGTRASNQSDCYRGESSEFIFSGSTTGYLDFLEVARATSANFEQSGYISVRFSRTSSALLSMHNWPGPLAVSIETASLSGLRGNLDWLRFLHTVANGAGGRPHWGQINQLTEPLVAGLYGGQLNRWREVLMAHSGQSVTFSNAYTRQAGLEPLGVMRHVRRVRRRHGTTTHLCGGVDDRWGPVRVPDAVNQIRSGAVSYYTEAAGSLARLVVVDGPTGAYLRSEADEADENNLDRLPRC